jgi:hypothetical protein
MNNFNIDIDALAPMIFLKNPNDLPIELNILDPLKNTKDIFYFCTDLFLKGLFFMNANKDMQVVINDLALDDIFSTVKKLKNAKIQTNITIDGNEIDKSQYKYIIKKSIECVKKMPDNELLQEYYLLIPIDDSIYKISFQLLQ